MLFPNFSVEEVINAVKDTNPSKATGEQGLLELIKNFGPH